MAKGLCTYYGTYHLVCHTAEEQVWSKSQHHSPEKVCLGLNSAIPVNHSLNLCDSFQQNKCGCPHQNLQQDGEHSIKDGEKGKKKTTAHKMNFTPSRQSKPDFHLSAASVNSVRLKATWLLGTALPQQLFDTFTCHSQGATAHVSLLFLPLNVLVRQN